MTDAEYIRATVTHLAAARTVDEIRAHLERIDAIAARLDDTAGPRSMLHAEIMNIDATLPSDLLSSETCTFAVAYRLGHRDARHAAAELVVAKR